MRHTKLTTAVFAVLTALPLLPLLPLASPALAGPKEEAYAIVNRFRAQSGIAPIGEDANLLAGVKNHSCWMAANDAIAHGEVPGSPGYTASGDLAGQRSNVIVSTGAMTPQATIDLWMTGPYHAIGLLRPELRSVAYDTCTDTAGTWRYGASIDVISGIDPTLATTTPIVYPGNGATTHLDRFVAESPNPLDNCGYTEAGLPLIAMMPESPTNATASLTGPSGPVTTCTVSPETDKTGGRSILAGDNAVLVIPQSRLAPGTYQASVTTAARTVAWSFTVDPTYDPTSLPAPYQGAPAHNEGPLAPAVFGSCQAAADAVNRAQGLNALVADRLMRSLIELEGTAPLTDSQIANAHQQAVDWVWVKGEVTAAARGLSVWGGTVRCGQARVAVTAADAAALAEARSEAISLVRWMRPYERAHSRLLRQTGR
jgi:Cysteine-rich secretory protein family